MNSKPVLTSGCLEKILKEKKQQKSATEDHYLVQILSSKPMTSGSIRCILFDGIGSTNKVVLTKSPQMDAFNQNHDLDNFSVIRLNVFWVSTLAQNDVEIIIISDITPIMRGSEVNQKLDVFLPKVETMDTSFVNTFTSNAIPSNDMPFQNTFNPNYRPRNQSFNESVVTPIDKSKLCSINDIQPYYNSFVIRVRIANKSPVKTFVGKDGRGDGKLFSFDASDETSEIRITAFNNECNKFFDFIEKDLIYYISKGNVKTANKKFHNLKSDYEITLNSESQIEICEESVPLPSIQFKFLPIGQIMAQNKGTSVDVIGIITKVEDLQTIVSKKDQKEYQKRDVLLIDKTLHEVRLTFWAEGAVNFKHNTGHVLAVKNAVVNDFRGKTLGTIQMSVIEIDPDVTEAHLLKGWYDRESKSGRPLDVIPLCKLRDDKQISQMRYLCQINLQSVPEGSVLYYSSKITIMSTNRADKHLYKSCGKNGCMKKVEEENGFYYCKKCAHNSPEFEWRLLLTICVADCTAEAWITVFQEVAEKIIGKTVGELNEMLESDPNQYQSIISGLHFKSFMFRIGSKVEEYNNEKRIKSTCYESTPIDAIDRSKKLIQSIKSWPK